jgi:hypothetical protein
MKTHALSLLGTTRLLSRSVCDRTKSFQEEKLGSPAALFATLPFFRIKGTVTRLVTLK